eukprot:3279947-Rhodomonas_salina.1
MRGTFQKRCGIGLEVRCGACFARNHATKRSEGRVSLLRVRKRGAGLEVGERYHRDEYRQP